MRGVALDVIGDAMLPDTRGTVIFVREERQSNAKSQGDELNDTAIFFEKGLARRFCRKKREKRAGIGAWLGILLTA